MAAATFEMDNKELKKQTEDIEEMISLLKQLTSGEKREVKGMEAVGQLHRCISFQWRCKRHLARSQKNV